MQEARGLTSWAMQVPMIVKIALVRSAPWSSQVKSQFRLPSLPSTNRRSSRSRRLSVSTSRPSECPGREGVVALEIDERMLEDLLDGVDVVPESSRARRPRVH